MVNTNSPFGFRPLGIYGAAQPTMQLDTGKVAATVPNALFRGDLLCRLSTGYLDKYPVGGAGGTAGVSSIAGIFWGAKYLSSAFGRTIVQQFLPTTDPVGETVVYYIPCNNFPSPLLAVQVAGAAVGFGSIGMNVEVNVGGGGSVKGTYGLSSYTVSSTPAVTTTLPFRIVGLLSDYYPAGTPGTDNLSANNIVVVSSNLSQLTGY